MTQFSESRGGYLSGNDQETIDTAGLKSRVRRLIAKGLFRSSGLRAFIGAVNCWEPAVSRNGARKFPFIKRRRQKTLQILIYHRVNDERDPCFPATPCAIFEEQMAYLSSQYVPCSLDEAVARLRHNDLPDNAVVVTFDDGYRDNFLHAYPILTRFRIPATIFLATDAIGSGRVLWFEQVFEAFRKTRQTTLYAFGNPLTDYSLGAPRQRLDTQRKVLGMLRSLPNEVRQDWLKILLDRLEVSAAPNRAGVMLSWDEVRLMDRGGISFGSHTVTHPILSQVSSAQTSFEVEESKRTIEKQLGKPVKGLAYPNGSAEDFTETTKRALQEAGYSYALTTIPGVNRSGEDLFELRRATPWEQTISEFAFRLGIMKWNS
jgi:peptidoglycan/xylan/chitin deacetylase (PgdA/CDA1 family)